MMELRDRLLRKLRERLYIHQVRGVLDTPPLVPRDDGVIVYSMIGTKVLLPYLVAVKSLHHFLRRGRVVILDDGTLTDADKAVLAHHLGKPEILSTAKVDTHGCPTYSSWKRLFALLELRRENYVIQLDSDTVTIGDVPLVTELVDRKTSFILRGEDGVAFTDPATIARQARAYALAPGEKAHVQLAMEAEMDRVSIPGHDKLRYVRGCAGFSGFAPDPGGSRLAASAIRPILQFLERAFWPGHAVHPFHRHISLSWRCLWPGQPADDRAAESGCVIRSPGSLQGRRSRRPGR